ncbi:MAG: DUF3788 family protein [Methanobacterium sp.]|uniref:DUF3788 family protein n=1 Tax=Methanobacterium sp. TaxID=2164 RepID=UPI003D65E547|nr:DUF3788 family protein [Methanobacterium sp.]
MEEKPFLDENSKPTEDSLKTVLGNAFAYYETLMDIADSFSKDWNFFKSSGWMLKVHDRKKALFYIVPLKNEFKISMAIRENERKAFLKDDKLKMIHNMIKSAKQYREGYALRFNVNDDEDFEIIEPLIKKLTAIRT